MRNNPKQHQWVQSKIRKDLSPFILHLREVITRITTVMVTHERTLLPVSVAVVVIHIIQYYVMWISYESKDITR